MKSFKSSIFLVLCISLIIVPHNILAKKTSKKSNANETKVEDDFDKEIYTWSRTLSEAFHLMKTKYYAKDFDVKEAMVSCINSFVSQDPHSNFMDPSSYKDIITSTSGEFYGIGIVITSKTQEDEFWPILDTIPDGPADKAGLLQGDKLIEIDGTALRGMTTDEATTKLKGEKNSKVHVKVIRDNYPEPLKFDIIRDVIKDQNSLCYHFIDNDVYYLHLAMFTQNASQQIEDLLNKAQKNSCKGIILDLRNNGGGLVPSAIELSGIFVDKGSIVVTIKDKNNNVTEIHKTDRDPIDTNGLPIFILVNNYTASAAEMLAGCLQIHSEKLAKQAGSKKQDHLIAFIVGTTTFGKGSMQEVIPVSNDCAMKITTALYFLPNNTTIQGVGITPDLILENKLPPTEQMEWVNKHYGRESALKKSIKTKKQEKNNKKKDKSKTPKEKEMSIKDRRKELIASDSQIQDTLTCINILNINPDSWNTRTDALKLLKKTFVTSSNINLEEVKA